MAMCAPTYEQPLCAMNHCSKCLGWETSMIGEGGAHVIKSSESPHHPRGPKQVCTSQQTPNQDKSLQGNSQGGWVRG